MIVVCLLIVVWALSLYFSIMAYRNARNAYKVLSSMVASTAPNAMNTILTEMGVLNDSK